MAPRDLIELGERLVQLRLIQRIELDQAILHLGKKASNTNSLLNNLESRNLLTSWQVSRIKKNEWDELVLGDYKLMYQNASGSFARVFRAGSLIDGHMVGIKVLRARWALEPRHVEDFHREAQLGMTLHHENIVPIYDHGTKPSLYGDIHYLVMEFVEGGNLRDFIQIRQQLSPREAMQYTLDIAQGLQAALRMGFTHRDLKLTNVLMSSKGVAKLVDFGLAGTDDEGHHQRAVEYATLEKATGAPTNDPRSDLFFLGMIIYELLSGRSPYPRSNDKDKRKQISRYNKIRPIAQITPEAPREVHQVVDRLTHFQPGFRYQSTEELIEHLHQIMPNLEKQEAEDQLAGTSFRPNGGSTVSAPEASSSSSPTVLCVEHRLKQQNVLREYLSRRGFRPLMVSHTDRALARIQASNPPDCVIFFGEASGDELTRAFTIATATSEKHPLAVVAVLAKEQHDLKSHLRKTAHNRVLMSPITLRDLRKEIHLALQHIHQLSSKLKSVST